MRKRWYKEKLEDFLVDYTESLTGKVVMGMTKNISKENSKDSTLSKEEKSLFETIQIISEVLRPRWPSSEFTDRICYSVRDKFEALPDISTEKIQRIIGMAVTMEDFRKNLFQDVVTACESVGFNLTPKEIAALKNIREDAVKEFASSLDERVTKFFPTNL